MGAGRDAGTGALNRTQELTSKGECRACDGSRRQPQQQPRWRFRHLSADLHRRLQPDGSLIPTDELGIAGAAGLGTGVVCVIDLDQNQPMGTVIQAIYANAGIPLPYARYVIDWAAMKSAANAGKAYTANTF